MASTVSASASGTISMNTLSSLSTTRSRARFEKSESYLGHSSIVMTMDVYGHLFPTKIDRAELAEASRLLLQPPPYANVVPLRR